jgi:DNA-binding CsgD family transcriptional regulator
MDFLKLAVTSLHKLVMYDSGVFYCAISKDSSFFQPYISGSIDEYYKREPFTGRETYLELNSTADKALVFKAADYRSGNVKIAEEPRSEFLSSEEEFHIICLRIIYKEQFLGEIYLHRSKDRPDFDENDIFILRLLQPHISNVFHLIHNYNAVKLFETDKKGLDKKGLCLFDSSLNLTAGNVAGLEMLNNSTVFGSSVLYHLKELMNDLLADKQANKADNLNTGVIFKSTGGDISAEIVMKLKNQGKKGCCFYVVLEYTDVNKVATDYKYKFTAREGEIIDGIIQGKSNQQISEMLNLSTNTIKTHMQKIFKKTGVSSRSELVYMLMLNKQ